MFTESPSENGELCRVQEYRSWEPGISLEKALGVGGPSWGSVTLEGGSRARVFAGGSEGDGA